MMCKCIGIHNSAILKIITIKKNGCAVAWAIRFINSVYSFFISLSSQLKFHHQTINVLCLQWNNIDPASQKDTGPIAWLHISCGGSYLFNWPNENRHAITISYDPFDDLCTTLWDLITFSFKNITHSQISCVRFLACFSFRPMNLSKFWIENLFTCL